MPISAAACGLAATARIALPIRVPRITRSSPSISRIATTRIRISWGRMPAPAMRITSSPSGEGTFTGAGPQTASPRLCTMMPKPIVLITQFIPALPAKGRTATAKRSRPSAPRTRPATRAATG